MWRLDVSDLDVVDLRRSEVREQLGVDLDDLTGPRRAAQELASRARELGAEGLILPSAAPGGTWNLVVFPSAFSKVRVIGSVATRPRPPG